MQAQDFVQRGRCVHVVSVISVFYVSFLLSFLVFLSFVNYILIIPNAQKPYLMPFVENIDL